MYVQTVPLQFFIGVLKMVKFSEDSMWYSTPLGQGMPNFLFQILLDSTLEFLDSVYIFSCWKIGHSQLENVLFETRSNIIESLENFNTQTTIVRNINSACS